MEDNYDKLDGFFRNRLRDESRSEDHWDRPDPQVWEQAQARLTDHSENKNWRFAYWPWFLLGNLLLGTLLTYIVILHQTNTELKEDLAKQYQVAISYQQETQKQTAKYQSKIIELEEEIVTIKKESVREISSVRQQIITNHKKATSDATQMALQYDQKIRALSQELALATYYLQTTTSQIIQNGDANPSQAQTSANSPQKWGMLAELATASIAPLPVGVTGVEPQVIVLRPTEDRRVENSWELGIQFGRALTTKDYKANFGEQVRTEELRSNLSNHTLELAIAYSPKTNWWISSGIRFLQYKGESSFKIGTEYDKAKEYLDDEGRKVNDLSLETVNYLQSNSFDVRIFNPTDVALEDQELITGELTHRQHSQLWQIPFDLEYRRQISKWGWQIHAGPTLNYQIVKENEIGGRLEALQRVLAVEVLEDESRGEKADLFLGFEGGVGLSYQLGDFVYARADLIGQINRKSLQPLVQFGLGYQF